MNYINLRKYCYKNRRRREHKLNADIDKWLTSPYNALKSKLYLEISSIFLFFLQHTQIKPNWITLLFAVSGIIGGVLLSSGEENMIIAGVIIFFFHRVFDDMDGDLARLKKQTSKLGEFLDDWGGLVGSFSFLIGLGMYLYNATQEINFIYLMILIITIRALDLKDYTYHRFTYHFYKNKKFLKKLTNNEKKIVKKNRKIPNTLIILKNFFQNFVDDRGRTVDLIGLIILIELSYDKIFLTNFIYYLIFLKFIMIFIGGFYLVYFKRLIERIILSIEHRDR